MITLLGTSKTMKTAEKNQVSEKFTKPVFNEKISFLSEFMKSFSIEQISEVMKTSGKLSKETFELFQKFSNGKNEKLLIPAIYAFTGDVFKAMDISGCNEQDLLFAQKSFFILSGMYGLLRPLDMIEPYRLEMGYNLGIKGYNKVSDFWKNDITDYLNSVIDLNKEKFIIDLASKEFTDSIDRKKLKLKLTDVVFKDRKDNKLKTVAIYAKQARGSMAGFIIKNRIEEKEELKKFKGLGYSYSKELSGEYKFTFTR
ncbi:MAG: YaaA family protein [Desulfobacteraceae bacterium]|nr:YaaA family protein [Desulfobacteraceae bacterium]